MTETERDEEIREFVFDNYALASTWAPEDVENWTSWAAQNGFLFLCYDKPGNEGKLVGLCIARPLSLGQAKNQDLKEDDFDLDGDLIYADLAISTAVKQGIRGLMLGIMQRMGTKALIGFKRVKTQGKFNIYRLGDFANKILRGKR